jgi:hypothetical protein
MPELALKRITENQSRDNWNDEIKNALAESEANQRQSGHRTEEFAGRLELMLKWSLVQSVR